MRSLPMITIAMLLCACAGLCAQIAFDACRRIASTSDGGVMGRGRRPARDLFWGVGGRDAAPDPNGEYQFVARDTTGKSPGYDVRDAQGRLWSVKLGPEAQSEVVVSRLLWAAGYFQPATYYLPSWTLVGAPDPNPQPPGRFRLEAERETRIGRWSWSANPFVGTEPLRGLFVLMVMVNNWDLKTQQNPAL